MTQIFAMNVIMTYYQLNIINVHFNIALLVVRLLKSNIINYNNDSGWSKIVQKYCQTFPMKHSTGPLTIHGSNIGEKHQIESAHKDLAKTYALLEDHKKEALAEIAEKKRIKMRNLLSYKNLLGPGFWQKCLRSISQHVLVEATSKSFQLFEILLRLEKS